MKELESKYLLIPGKKPGKVRRRLLQDLVWAGFRAHPQSTRLVHDVYYDTSDQRLHRAGWSLRCRRQEGLLQLTCKQLGRSDHGWFERREIEQSAMSETPSLETIGEGPVLDLLRRYVPISSSLIPCFEQHNRRTTYRLSHNDYPRSSVELAMDRVRLDGDRALSYVEFEGELKQGDAPLVGEFSAVMAMNPGLVASRVSKYHRGLIHIGARPGPVVRDRPVLTPEHPWSRLAASYLREQYLAVVEFEPFAYEGFHPEGVHQMRIATRRLGAALKALGPVLGKPQTRNLARQVGDLCDALGSVRDLDVQLENLSAYRDLLPERRQSPLREYERRLEAVHRRARTNLIDYLEDRRYSDLLSSYQCLQQQADALDPDGSPRIRAFAQSYVPGRLKSIRKAGRRITRRSAPAELHRLRILVKKLRYQLEILRGPYGIALTNASREFRRLQARLGDHQDACVAQAALQNYRASEALKRRERSTFDQLIEFEASAAARHRKRFGRDWERFEAESRRLSDVL